jgi:uncharacterized protein YjdB
VLAPIVGTPIELLIGTWNTDGVSVDLSWSVAGTNPGSGTEYTAVEGDIGKPITVSVEATKEGYTPWIGRYSTARVAKAPESPPTSDGSPDPDGNGGTNGLDNTPSAPVTKVKVSQTTVTLAVGKRVSVAAAGYTAAGASQKATWKSSNTKVASVSAGRITAKAVGSAVITVKAGTKTTKIKVRVVRVPSNAKATTTPKKVSATGIKKTMKVGAVAWASAKYTPTTARGVKVTFKSSRPAVLSIDRTGRIVAKAPGTAVVTVKAGGKSKKYTVKVS